MIPTCIGPILDYCGNPGKLLKMTYMDEISHPYAFKKYIPYDTVVWLLYERSCNPDRSKGYQDFIVNLCNEIGATDVAWLAPMERPKDNKILHLMWDDMAKFTFFLTKFSPINQDKVRTMVDNGLTPWPQGTAGYAAQRNNWMPISSAPRDGTLIDIWVSMIDYKGKINHSSVDGRFPDCAWVKEDNCWYTHDNTKMQEQVNYSKLKSNHTMMIVTHWRYRPDAPI